MASFLDAAKEDSVKDDTLPNTELVYEDGYAAKIDLMSCRTDKDGLPNKEYNPMAEQMSQHARGQDWTRMLGVPQPASEWLDGPKAPLSPMHVPSQIPLQAEFEKELENRDIKEQMARMQMELEKLKNKEKDKEEETREKMRAEVTQEVLNNFSCQYPYNAPSMSGMNPMMQPWPGMPPGMSGMSPGMPPGLPQFPPDMMAQWNMMAAQMMPSMPPAMPPLPGHGAGEVDSGKQAPDLDDLSHMTTVMWKNIPNNYTRDMLLKLTEDRGFKGKIDFIYFPYDFQRKAALGYAFVNFTEHDHADEFYAKFHGKKGQQIWTLKSEKMSEVQWSDKKLQGLQANLDRYRDSPVMHPDIEDYMKPVLLIDGERSEFPKPTKKIRAPHQKETKPPGK